MVSHKNIDKIFQPSLTTKPTGQGTGLGLSLACDIIKAHGGEIKVATKEGEGGVYYSVANYMNCDLWDFWN
jgi:signal transduction histidine kinase